jgi:peptide/nickel transport system substrate-binding protein
MAFHQEAPRMPSPLSTTRRRTLAAHLATICLPWALATAPLHTLAQPKAGGELRIALSYDPSSLDPHFAATSGNVTVSSHFFDCLVNTDPAGQYVPGLALSWRTVDPTTWEVKLRPGVKFTDGSPFTADDVAFSLERPAKVLNSPGPFTSYTKPITRIQVVDALTLRLKTAEPYGPLPGDLASIFIVSKKAAANASTEDFNSGKALVGTGPYQFASYKRGESVNMVRNAAYWGEKSAWEKVNIRFIPTDPARVAALLSGDVDMIEGVPPSDMPRLKLDAKLQVVQRSTWRTLFLHLNHGAADDAAVFTDKASGKPLGRNPLKDIRVREALSLGLNREALVKTALEGFAAPAGQVVAEGVSGFDPALKPGGYDVAGAKKLLADAGYPQGFGIVLTVPNNRYINDDQVGQTVVQLWSRIGIAAKLQAMPMATYVPKMKNGEFGAALLGWGTLGADFGLRTLLGTPDPAKGWGTWNWGKYSNPKLDAQIAASLGSTDPAKRDANARLAMAIAMKDFAVLPTHYQFASWAMRKGLGYPGRLDEFTFAQQVRVQQP